jgi:replicative DNA helicase
MIFDEVLKKIDRGKEGLNIGLPMGFNRLVDYVPDIQQGTYYLVGGETGTGKTAFADNCFLYNPYDWIKSHPDSKMKMKVIYWSFEIDKSVKMTKGICKKLYTDFNIITDINFVLSRGKNRVSQEIYDRVILLRDYFEEMEDVLEIFDGAMNPTGINRFMLNYARANGEFVMKKYKTDDGKEGEAFDHYVPNDPNLYTIVLIDHVSLTKKEQGLKTKETVDKLSEYLIPMRNNFNFIPVVVQQIGRANTQVDRIKLDRMEPQLSDFKDSGNTQQDANVIMSLFAPHRHEMENFRGFDITKLKDRFRSLKVLKNRDGSSDFRIPLHFIGEVGQFTELPKLSQFNADPRLYETYGKLKVYGK